MFWETNDKDVQLKSRQASPNKSTVEPDQDGMAHDIKSMKKITGDLETE
jgi:hypothetical protein